ncbi:MAG: hypothetical protein DMG05_07990 [Acidobacteria bacterium]|nr:MAG: hypothetical protein DMG05_07990 [Acidobacteriota bacterium]
MRSNCPPFVVAVKNMPQRMAHACQDCQGVVPNNDPIAVDPMNPKDEPEICLQMPNSLCYDFLQCCSKAVAERISAINILKGFSWFL